MIGMIGSNTMRTILFIDMDHLNHRQQQQKPLAQRPFQNFKTKTSTSATIKKFALQDTSLVELPLPDTPRAPSTDQDTVTPDMRAFITELQSNKSRGLIY
mmetsp:Transcript_19823/g.24448  ORF Transcript_19823/g.24448 Transcript_19823/m.24448 type:complete len:100 (+) Transcript_19823:1410-1709(+)